MNKNNIVWATVASGNDETRVSTHGYYSNERTDEWGKYTGGTHLGNSALCNKRIGVSEDGSSYLPIEKIEGGTLNRETACKKCLKIFDKL